MYSLAYLSFGRKLANCLSMYFSISGGESRIRAYKGCRTKHILTMFLIAFLALDFSYSVLCSYKYTANRWVSDSYSATSFAWSGVCPPICPSAQADAPLTRSSGTCISESFKTVTPLLVMIDIAV